MVLCYNQQNKSVHLQPISLSQHPIYRNFNEGLNHKHKFLNTSGPSQDNTTLSTHFKGMSHQLIHKLSNKSPKILKKAMLDATFNYLLDHKLTVIHVLCTWPSDTLT